jgi:hypothetical protein
MASCTAWLRIRKLACIRLNAIGLYGKKSGVLRPIIQEVVEGCHDDGTRRFDEAGNLWVELYKEDTTKEFTYDVFSPEGIFLKQVRIDQRIFEFENGRVYSIVRPEDGYPSIKRFLMELVAESIPASCGKLILSAAAPRTNRPSPCGRIRST